MNADELAFRERYAPTPVVSAQPTAPVAPMAAADPTENLPLFINGPVPATDAELDRLFAQE